MSQLEEDLINAFNVLSIEHELQNAQAKLQQMLKATLKENVQLRMQIEHLDNKIGNLNGQIRLLKASLK